MKRFLILALVIKLSAGVVIAQINDTIKAQQLNEVVVNASYNTADARRLKFTPTSKQKNSSQNGIDLLRRMAIPQIKVSLSDDRVTTQSGEPVAIFINYVTASSQELETSGELNTSIHHPTSVLWAKGMLLISLFRLMNTEDIPSFPFMRSSYQVYLTEHQYIPSSVIRK